ncbi:hypothetical protein OIU84_011846 [Salix udensis]|uniref:VQ domain-containing protein n=1 Tax=Salix udensis TaxID=889485 RepID=A0AAD6NXE8_9ROSI|nr:hypothetical protein OIU84_011846 [Salix udensis]
MSGIMSDNPTDWSQFYQHNLSNDDLPPIRSMFGDRVADATAVATSTINTSSVPDPMGSGSSRSSAAHLSPDGRVAKPIRKRSRASRRTPTTLLNTDTTNFRAMVQQFTGGPSAPFASGSQINATNFGFALGAYRQAHHVNQPSPLMMPPAGYNLQYQQQQQQQQFQQQTQNPPPYMFSLSNSNVGTGTAAATTAAPGDMFFQRLGNPRPATNMEVSGHRGFGSAEGAVISSLVAPPSRPPSSSSNENRSNTFLF